MNNSLTAYHSSVLSILTLSFSLTSEKSDGDPAFSIKKNKRKITVFVVLGFQVSL